MEGFAESPQHAAPTPAMADDLANCSVILAALVEALTASPTQSFERRLALASLADAGVWLRAALAKEEGKTP